MSRVILVLNVGSSSIKADLFAADAPEPVVQWTGKKEEVSDFEKEFHALLKEVPHEEITAVGHRIVHGGAELPSPVRIDDDVMTKLAATVRLAPLHNPPALEGIRVARAALPTASHYAVFDTAFHRTMPEHARRYAVSEKLHSELGVERFGFHGTSHVFVAKKAAERLGRPLDELRLITLHLGNGSSACAIRGGRSIDTSMGMTPLEGLVMGTRSGDLDAAVPVLLAREGWSTDEIERELNQRSGLKGLAGASDMRELLERSDPAAKLALEIFTYRIQKYIGAYHAILGGPVDALVFTGGIGEHATKVREAICAGISHLQIANVLVIATDEELEMARQIRGQLDGGR